MPLIEGTPDDVDNNGVVLRLNWKEISFLLTADIRQETEYYLIAQRANLRSTVLKVAHHGSRTSTSLAFLAVSSPQVTVITSGADNRFGLPNSEVVDRLNEKVGVDRLYQTSRHGTVEFITDGNRLWVKVRQPSFQQELKN